MTHPYMKGKQVELELAKKLWKAGYAVMRAPASGARAKKVYYPDILAVKYDGEKHRVLVLEVKLRAKRNTIQLAGPKVWRLHEYTRRAGGEAYIVVKVPSEGRWFIFPLQLLKREEHEGKVRYVITMDAYDRALGLEALLE